MFRPWSGGDRCNIYLSTSLHLHECFLYFTITASPLPKKIADACLQSGQQKGVQHSTGRKNKIIEWYTMPVKQVLRQLLVEFFLMVLRQLSSSRRNHFNTYTFRRGRVKEHSQHLELAQQYHTDTQLAQIKKNIFVQAVQYSQLEVEDGI